MARKHYKKDIDPEFGLDSRYLNKEEQEAESKALMEHRLRKMKDLSRDDIIRAKLLQLKLRMEAYLQQPVYDKENHFSEFLKTYVDTLYPVRKIFASDLGVNYMKLIHILNDHRQPNEEFIKKLMIHSELVYKHVGDFQKKTWYQVYFHEKVCDTMSSQDEWRPEVEKEVKLSEGIL